MAVMHSSKANLLAFLVTLAVAGCGGTAYEDALVAADSTANGDSGTDQEQQLDGGGTSGPVTVPESYAAGESFRLEPGASASTVLMPCKTEDDSGEMQFTERRIRFEPATGDFFVDSGRVFEGGFSWEPESREFVANRVVPIGTATGEYDAKVTADGRPSYYRYKLTLQNFRFQQTECFEGLAR